ncbi:rod shape-determining protein MreC [Magnetovirga frankeli]|uniref:rod shape-determining protein MreC n=1 Tax=Magnetovirga frankeli TaxID=947516 RepID=UPI003D32A867
MFLVGPSATVRLAIAVLLSLTMLGMEYRERHLSGFRSLLATITYPLVYLVELPYRVSEALSHGLASHRALLADNQHLFEENLRLRARLLSFDALEKENMRLRALLDSSFKIGDNVLISELIHVDLDPYRHHIQINKGSQAGVYQGQPALDANAVMGQVVQVNPWDSTVLLITDSEHSLPVQISRTGLRTIAVGTGKIDSLRLPFLPNNSDVREGDRITTSGLAGQFPAGYPVATVNSVQRKPGAPFTEALATPDAQLDRSREILLVWSNRLEDADNGEQAARPEETP